MNLIKIILSDLGFDTLSEWLESGSSFGGPMDSVARGACKKCGACADVEPDSANGWCEVCEANTVVSLHILIGVM